VTDFAELGVATVYEAAGRQGLIDLSFELWPQEAVAGPARIARCGQGDNLAVHAVMERLQPGEVLVLTMPEPAPVALIGDLLATQARVHGAVAVLVDAAVRDVEELELPVWARWVRVRGATKDDPGELDVPVEVGGAAIRPGDLVVLDSDGACVVGAERVEEVREAALARVEKERVKRERLQAGELSYDIDGLRP
jgi:4-hydroxy-4-methyl-2-oxoglutarate aldolase